MQPARLTCLAHDVHFICKLTDEGKASSRLLKYNFTNNTSGTLPLKLTQLQKQKFQLKVLSFLFKTFSIRTFIRIS